MKDKLFNHNAMKTCGESGDLASRFTELDTRWRLAVSFKPGPLYHWWKNPILYSQWERVSLGPKAGLDGMTKEKIPALLEVEPRSSNS